MIAILQAGYKWSEQTIDHNMKMRKNKSDGAEWPKANLDLALTLYEGFAKKIEQERGIPQVHITSPVEKYQIIQVKAFHIIEHFLRNFVSLQHCKFFPLSFSLSLLSISSCLCFIEQKLTPGNVASSVWDALRGYGADQQMNRVNGQEYTAGLFNFDAKQQ